MRIADSGAQRCLEWTSRLGDLILQEQQAADLQMRSTEHRVEFGSAAGMLERATEVALAFVAVGEIQVRWNVIGMCVQARAKRCQPIVPALLGEIRIRQRIERRGIVRPALQDLPQQTSGGVHLPLHEHLLSLFERGSVASAVVEHLLLPWVWP